MVFYRSSLPGLAIDLIDVERHLVGCSSRRNQIIRYLSCEKVQPSQALYTKEEMRHIPLSFNVVIAHQHRHS